MFLWRSFLQNAVTVFMVVKLSVYWILERNFSFVFLCEIVLVWESSQLMQFIMFIFV